MDEMQVDVEDSRATGFMDDDMLVPDLFEQCFGLRHDGFSLSERERGGPVSPLC